MLEMVVCKVSGISSISFQGTSKKEKTKQKKNILGGALALTAGSITKKAVTKTTTQTALNNLVSPSVNLSKDELSVVQDGVKKTFNKLFSENKNVKFKNYTKTPDVTSDVADIKTIKDGFNFYLENAAKTLGWTIEYGKNAFFVGKLPKFAKEAFEKAGLNENSINVNLEKLPLAAFHEMGHAYNFNNSAFWKSIQKIRNISMLAPIIALIPAFTKEIKPQDGKELTDKDKRHNTIRKAAPFAAAMMYLPMVAEEARATIRGNKWAKQVFEKTPELAKKVAKTNAWGMASYVAVPVAIMLSSLIGKKVKDVSDEKRAEKLAFKQTKMEYHQG